MDDSIRAPFLAAVALHQQGNFAAAVEAYRDCLARAPQLAQGHHNLGLALIETGDMDEAERCLRTALDLRPDYVVAYKTLGDLLKRRRRFEEAISCYERALGFKPDYIEACTDLANTLAALGRKDDAREALRRAVAAAPDNYKLQWTIGRTFTTMNFFADALAALSRAAELAPQSIGVLCSLLNQRRIVCAWQGSDDLERTVLNAVRENGGGVEPLDAVMTLPTGAAEQLWCARAKAATLSSVPKFGIAPGRGDRNHLRIGYLSADLWNHATAFLMAEVFELHDRKRFETVALSYGPDDKSPMRQRLERGFDTFIDVAAETDEQIARRIAAENIDILIDLNAYSGFARPGIVARRPAPIQVTHVGYPGTTGSDFMDYIIADTQVIPPEHERFYSEKAVLMPESYQPNDRRREIGVTKTRAEYGLPERGFVFCSFNANYKLRPDVFAIWMRLLRDLPEAVLWLIGSDPLAMANLRHEAQARGVDPARLMFAPWAPLADHLARYRRADLFLDTLPCSAHTTMSDCLWAGLPAVTCIGSSFVGRVGGSLLKAVGLSELITATLDDYERLIRSLVDDPERLGRLRATLAANLPTAPLFDTPRYTRALETAYAEMWRVHRAGEAPRRIVVAG